MMSKSKNLSPFTVAILIVIVLGCTLAVYGMRWGPWAGSDSVAYIEAARNLAKGDGLVLRQASGDIVPLSLHPPLFSVLLATLSVFSSDMILTAKIANIVLMGLYILLISISYGFCLNQPKYSIIVSFLFLSSPLFLLLFTGVMSEPLFFVTSLLSLLLIIIYLKRNTPMILILSALATSMSLLTRYVGVAVVAAGALGLLVFSQRSLLKRGAIAVSYSVIAVLPFVFWTVNLQLYGEYSGIVKTDFRGLWGRLTPFKMEFMEILWRWLKFDIVLTGLDYDSKLNILLMLMVIIFCTLIIASYKSKSVSKFSDLVRMTSFQFPVIFLIFSFFFLIVTAFAFLFTTQLPEVPNERIMSPFLMGLLVGGSSMAVFLLDLHPNNRLLKYLLPLFFVFFIGCQITPGLSYIQDLHENGSGYTSKDWQSSELLERVKGLPLDFSIISNEADAILLCVDRPAYRIPELEQGEKHDVFETFGQDVEDNVQQIFREKEAALVLFDTVYWQFNAFYYQKTEERLEAFTRNLCLSSEVADGEIYFYQCP